LGRLWGAAVHSITLLTNPAAALHDTGEPGE